MSAGVCVAGVGLQGAGVGAGGAGNVWLKVVARDVAASMDWGKGLGAGGGVSRGMKIVPSFSRTWDISVPHVL